MVGWELLISGELGAPPRVCSVSFRSRFLPFLYLAHIVPHCFWVCDEDGVNPPSSRWPCPLCYLFQSACIQQIHTSCFLSQVNSLQTARPLIRGPVDHSVLRMDDWEGNYSLGYGFRYWALPGEGLLMVIPPSFLELDVSL